MTDRRSSSLPRTDLHRPGSGEQRATRLIFFAAGFATAAWGPLVPFARGRAGLDTASLGLLLLCLGLGSIIAMPLAAALAARLGCRLVITVCTLLLAGAVPLLATLDSFASLVAALLLFGASLGSVDVVMNIQAVLVERASGRAMMSGFHGLFSLGGIAGSAGFAAMLGAGASPPAAALVVAGVIVLLLAASFPRLLPVGGRSDGPPFAIPRGIVVVIAALAFVLFLVEGAILDWSAVFLTGVRHLDPAYGGLGYAAFAATMTAGRLSGDRVVRSAGPVRVVAAGGVLAAIGFLLTILVPFWWSALAGYALVGAGCSNIVPVLFSSAGRQRVMPENLAVPAITTVGYVGILLGPAAIGAVASLTSLSTAFALLAAGLLAVAASARRLRQP